jgi:CheY-like chemotaxis protein
MKDLVIDVGNCSYDHNSVKTMLTSWFEVEVAGTEGLADTLSLLRTSKPTLIVVNRKLDTDHSDGLEIIKTLKADPQYSSIPMMLISNFDDQQKLAVESGAVYGFGKRSLKDPETKARLMPILGHATTTHSTSN